MALLVPADVSTRMSRPVSRGAAQLRRRWNSVGFDDANHAAVVARRNDGERTVPNRTVLRPGAPGHEAVSLRRSRRPAATKTESGRSASIVGVAEWDRRHAPHAPATRASERIGAA
jgi:hypothetical protein